MIKLLCACMCIYIYMYIYLYTEFDIDSLKLICTYMCFCIYIYIYVCNYIYLIAEFNIEKFKILYILLTRQNWKIKIPILTCNFEYLKCPKFSISQYTPLQKTQCAVWPSWSSRSSYHKFYNHLYNVQSALSRPEL